MNNEIKSTGKQIAILGCGPAGLFMYKRLIETGEKGFEITIFEKKMQAGAGMPYSREGANDEHVTNVSDNEIPTIVNSIEEWSKTAPKELLKHFKIDPENFNEYKVLPRLFFGEYLSAQFELLYTMAKEAGITTHLHFGKQVWDIIDLPESNEVKIMAAENDAFTFGSVIICTGHNWPKKNEGIIPGYFDSPYPPSKLALKINDAVAIKGASLTAIDAIRTLSRCNGSFTKEKNGMLSFEPAAGSENFRVVMHSLGGLLPALRFHLEDSHLSNDALLTPKEIEEHIKKNGGFLSLDHIFENDFKKIFFDRDPEFYEIIKGMSIEEFVDKMMALRERLDPFTLLKAEYEEAEKSIKRKQSVYWKEMLAVLSFAMNYPAKHFPAEDMLRLQKVLMPLISIVIAFIPQSSCLELLALHEKGILELVPVGMDSSVRPEESGGATYTYTDEEKREHSTYYKMYVDCIGQPHLNYEDLPFKSLITNKTVSPATLPFRSAEEGKKQMDAGNKQVALNAKDEYYLKVTGITINDNFHVVDPYGAFNPRIFIMAVPYIGGYNPDYSGLDFCAEASSKISKVLIERLL